MNELTLFDLRVLCHALNGYLRSLACPLCESGRAEELLKGIEILIERKEKEEDAQ
jgi:hypothetical protein